MKTVPFALLVWSMLTYKIAESTQTLIISDEVLAHFNRYRQLRFWQSEAGGQLFAEIENNTIKIVKVTGPRKADWRTRVFYFAHRPSDQREIDLLFEQGLHYVGDWHTHPEKYPRPSQLDIRTFYETFRQSDHSLAGMIFIIVGQETIPGSLYVAICDGIGLMEIDKPVVG